MSDPTEIPPSTVQSMAARYGSDRPRRRWVGVALGGLLAVALGIWAVWAGQAQDDEPLTADVTSYHVVDTHQIQVKVAATFHDAGAEGSCLVRATAQDHTVVGELTLTADQLRADDGHWIAVRTERRATTASVVRCGG